MYPVCVYLYLNSDGVTGKIPLKADGSLWLGAANDPTCVPITRKIAVTPSNYSTAYKSSLLRKTGCAFAVNRSSDHPCAVPPATFFGAQDSVFSNSNLKEQSYWYRYGEAYSEQNTVPTGSMYWDVTGVVNNAVIDDDGVASAITDDDDIQYSTAGTSATFAVATSSPFTVYDAGTWDATFVQPGLLQICTKGTLLFSIRR